MNAVAPCTGRTRETTALQLKLFGPIQLRDRDSERTLPKSRKVRALLAYLAMTSREVSRTRLCELLWDSPSDPRSELRWCLSRLRSVLDDEAHARVVTRGDTVALDLSDCDIDVIVLEQALQQDLRRIDLECLRHLATSVTGELLEDLSLDDLPVFSQWLGAERRRIRVAHAKLLAALVDRCEIGAPEIVDHLGRWLAIEPFEQSAHQRLIQALVKQGRLREAEEHLTRTMRLFELEGIEWSALRETWRQARQDRRKAEAASGAARSAVITSMALEQSTASPAQAAQSRASICIIPFVEQTASGVVRSRLGDGLADDIITRLAKLRTLFVIARGTAFSLVDRNVEPEEAARLLGVAYLVNGTVRRRAGRIEVRVELVETHRPRVVWAEDLDCDENDALSGLDRLGHGIVASIAEEVETAERNRAVLKAPNSLNAWEAYHRGLWHLYRFNEVDNDRAEHFFRLSTQLDPTFARAHSGLSFAHFQNAFLHRPQERAAQIALAYETAGQSLLADDRDPAAHWAMGRALWLRGAENEAMAQIGTSVELSPNFALGHYTMGFFHAQSGDPNAAIGSIDYSQALSPFDPLQFAMLATHALAHARLGNHEQAAIWALKAAGRPNAHTHVLAIAAHCLALAGRVEEARAFAARIRAKHPHYGIEDFLAGFRFTSEASALFRSGAKRIGFA